MTTASNDPLALFLSFLPFLPAYGKGLLGSFAARAWLVCCIALTPIVLITFIAVYVSWKRRKEQLEDDEDAPLRPPQKKKNKKKKQSNDPRTPPMAAKSIHPSNSKSKQWIPLDSSSSWRQLLEDWSYSHAEWHSRHTILYVLISQSIFGLTVGAEIFSLLFLSELLSQLPNYIPVVLFAVFLPGIDSFSLAPVLGLSGKFWPSRTGAYDDSDPPSSFSHHSYPLKYPPCIGWNLSPSDRDGRPIQPSGTAVLILIRPLQLQIHRTSEKAIQSLSRLLDSVLSVNLARESILVVFMKPSTKKSGQETADIESGEKDDDIDAQYLHNKDEFTKVCSDREIRFITVPDCRQSVALVWALRNAVLNTPFRGNVERVLVLRDDTLLPGDFRLPRFVETLSSSGNKYMIDSESDSSDDYSDSTESDTDSSPSSSSSSIDSDESSSGSSSEDEKEEKKRKKLEPKKKKEKENLKQKKNAKEESVEMKPIPAKKQKEKEKEKKKSSKSESEKVKENGAAAAAAASSAVVVGDKKSNKNKEKAKKKSNEKEAIEIFVEKEKKAKKEAVLDIIAVVKEEEEDNEIVEANEKKKKAKKSVKIEEEKEDKKQKKGEKKKRKSGVPEKDKKKQKQKKEKPKKKPAKELESNFDEVLIEEDTVYFFSTRCISSESILGDDDMIIPSAERVSQQQQPFWARMQDFEASLQEYHILFPSTCPSFLGRTLLRIDSNGSTLPAHASLWTRSAIERLFENVEIKREGHPFLYSEILRISYPTDICVKPLDGPQILSLVPVVGFPALPDFATLFKGQFVESDLSMFERRAIDLFDCDALSSIWFNNWFVLRRYTASTAFLFDTLFRLWAHLQDPIRFAAFGYFSFSDPVILCIAALVYCQSMWLLYGILSIRGPKFPLLDVIALPFFRIFLLVLRVYGTIAGPTIILVRSLRKFGIIGSSSSKAARRGRSSSRSKSRNGRSKSRSRSRSKSQSRKNRRDEYEDSNEKRAAEVFLPSDEVTGNSLLS